MRVKVYEVSYKDDCGHTYKLWVDAPNKRIAKWCGANLFNNQYVAFLSAKDIKAKRYRVKGGDE
jgi:hypothetical protein